MQILIDIGEKAYEYAKTRMALFLDVNTEILKAVENGTVLPEKHGDLIDRNEYFAGYYNDAREFLDNATTIIPAVKGDANENN